ncbi:hypothetical protein A0H81_10299 [Grifola frondosa]|uniref:Uncharacterized protein n=1 Tax=Grifola frondosa TaxID=5627 RepID=A0A1C7LYN3_GRIFR|nr:hypothetical protein A0H81_10299 [Grifola frondosa]
MLPPRAVRKVAGYASKNPQVIQREDSRDAMTAPVGGGSDSHDVSGSQENSEDENEVDLDDEGQDDPEEPKAGTRKKTKVGRAEVLAVRTETGALNVGKRKDESDGTYHDMVTKKLKKTPAPSGLIKEWKNQSGVSTGSRRGDMQSDISSAHSSAYSKSNPSSAAPSDYEGDADYSDACAQYGGFADEDESHERASLSARTSNNLRWDAVSSRSKATQLSRSLQDIAAEVGVDRAAARCDELTQIKIGPPIIGVAVANLSAGGRKSSAKKATRTKFTNKDLPTDMRDAFTNILVPLAREHAGTLPAWTSLTLTDIQALFDRVFPDIEYSVQENDVFYDLISYRVHDWRSSFAQAAIAAFDKQIKENQEDFKTREDVAAYVTYALGNDPEVKNAPFLWKSWGGGIKKTGRFQSELILSTFTAHLAALSAIPHEFRTSFDYPRGALILSILAVERALVFWRKGTLQIPTGQAGYFSADNWGDRVEIHSGHPKAIKKASKYLRVLDTFTTADWNNILDGAKKCYNEKKRVLAATVTLVVDDSDDEFMLMSDKE